METIQVSYKIRARDIKRAARLVAREQSLGVKVTSYETDAVKRLEAAVKTIRRSRQAADVTIEVASEAIDSAYGLILSIAGEISCLGELSAIQLADFEIPERLARRLGGPRWGGDGLRRHLGIQDRPIFISVVKPSQGLTPKEFGDLAYECFAGGIDIAKSDELLQESEGDYLARVRACVAAARRAEAETGERKLFMVHAVGPAGRIRDLYGAGIAAGAGIAMFAPAAIGFPQFQELASLGRVPMMAHMAMSGWLWQPHGMSVRAWAKFLRLFGADIILYPALEGTLRAERSELETIKEICRMDWHGVKTSMPAAGGGQHAATMPTHYQLYDADFIFLCGGGVVGHPKGARAGARSIRQAWEAIRQGVSLKQYAKQAPELSQSLIAFKKYV
jgi:ribulose-bisphosphate carboxylase large chain